MLKPKNLKTRFWNKISHPGCSKIEFDREADAPDLGVRSSAVFCAVRDGLVQVCSQCQADVPNLGASFQVSTINKAVISASRRDVALLLSLLHGQAPLV